MIALGYKIYKADKLSIVMLEIINLKLFLNSLERSQYFNLLLRVSTPI